MGERTSEYTRDGDDWYVEPAWCVEALKARIDFSGTIHDPCCGMGTIPQIMNGTGSDLVDRGYGYPVADFLADHTPREHIVTNPPYGMAQEIIEHALAVAEDKVAALVQTKFLSSQRRYGLFTYRPLKQVLIFSRRPSMPPGKLLQKHGESIRGNGSMDYCWMIWQNGFRGPTGIDWII